MPDETPPSSVRHHSGEWDLGSEVRSRLDRMERKLDVLISDRAGDGKDVAVLASRVAALEKASENADSDRRQGLVGIKVAVGGGVLLSVCTLLLHLFAKHT